MPIMRSPLKLCRAGSANDVDKQAIKLVFHIRQLRIQCLSIELVCMEHMEVEATSDRQKPKDPVQDGVKSIKLQTKEDQRSDDVPDVWQPMKINGCKVPEMGYAPIGRPHIS